MDRATTSIPRTSCAEDRDADNAPSPVPVNSRWLTRAALFVRPKMEQPVKLCAHGHNLYEVGTQTYVVKVRGRTYIGERCKACAREAVRRCKAKKAA